MYVTKDSMKNFTRKAAVLYPRYSWVGSFVEKDGVVKITLEGTPRIIVDGEQR